MRKRATWTDSFAVTPHIPRPNLRKANVRCKSLTGKSPMVPAVIGLLAVIFAAAFPTNSFATITYYYDLSGRLTCVDNGAGQSQYTYDDAGNITSITTPCSAAAMPADAASAATATPSTLSNPASPPPDASSSSPDGPATAVSGDGQAAQQ